MTSICRAIGLCGREVVGLAACLTYPWNSVVLQANQLQAIERVLDESHSLVRDLRYRLLTEEALEHNRLATINRLAPETLSMIFELVFLTILSLAPILGRSYLSKLISRSVDNSTENLCLDSEKECSLHTSSKKEYPFGLGAPADKDEEFDFDDISRRGRRIRRQRWTWKRLSVSVPRWQALHSPLRHSFPVNERDTKS